MNFKHRRNSTKYQYITGLVTNFKNTKLRPHHFEIKIETSNRDHKKLISRFSSLIDIEKKYATNTKKSTLNNKIILFKKAIKVGYPCFMGCKVSTIK